MKKRWIVGLAVFLLTAALLLPQLAVDIHYFFSGQTDRLTLHPLEAWPAVLAGGNALKFYLLLAAILMLGLIWILFTGSYLNYRSNMWVVTPDIITPCADGQGQFGTARWLQAKEFGSHYAVWKIPNKSTVFRELADAGKASYQEVENAPI